MEATVLSIVMQPAPAKSSASLWQGKIWTLEEEPAVLTLGLLAFSKLLLAASFLFSVAASKTDKILV